jgi:hypothetical protein
VTEREDKEELREREREREEEEEEEEVSSDMHMQACHALVVLFVLHHGVTHRISRFSQ